MNVSSYRDPSVLIDPSVAREANPEGLVIVQMAYQHGVGDIVKNCCAPESSPLPRTVLRWARVLRGRFECSVLLVARAHGQGAPTTLRYSLPTLRLIPCKAEGWEAEWSEGTRVLGTALWSITDGKALTRTWLAIRGSIRVRMGMATPRHHAQEDRVLLACMQAAQEALLKMEEAEDSYWCAALKRVHAREPGSPTGHAQFTPRSFRQRMQAIYS